MTTAIEEFLANINKRISVLEHELERLEEVRQGVAEGRGLTPRPDQRARESRRAA